MMQQPSAPNAVAMVRRGWNVSTAHWSTSWGDRFSSFRLAAASSASDIANTAAMRPLNLNNRTNEGCRKANRHYYTKFIVMINISSSDGGESEAKKGIASTQCHQMEYLMELPWIRWIGLDLFRYRRPPNPIQFQLVSCNSFHSFVQ